MYAPWMRCSFDDPIGPKQHVALSQQGLCPAAVEDHAGVVLRGHREGDSRRDVDLDRSVMMSTDGRWRGEHEVDPHGARLLREADDRVLDLGRRDHHQVGELVDHAQDVRERRLSARGPRAVQLDDVARACLPHHLVAPLHLADQVGEHVGRHPGDVHHRRQQVRDVLVVVQLHALRVDQHHPHLVGRGAHQDRRQHRVDAPGLPRAGGARDQEVRHACEVGPHGVAGDVLAEPDRQRRAARALAVLLGQLAAEDVAEVDHAVALVGHLDADRLLARDRRKDADVGGGERVRDVVLQLGDLRDLDAGREPQLVAGHARAGHLPDDLRLDAEVAERLDQQLRDVVLVGGVGRRSLWRSGAAASGRGARS